ncbi:MAG TPA: hemolysin family protein [Thermoanaerobaculia bacterium]|nr:hemolysin family protein [Thermoanaerobaculia bacterium]
MTFSPFGVWVGVLFAGAFAALYVLLSAFAQALESLSAIRRKALQDENPARFGRLLAPEHVNVSRIAVRLTAQGAVLGGLLSLGTMLAALGAPEPWLLSAVGILLGWIVLESFVIRWVGRRGADDLLHDFGWLIPVVTLFAAPLYPTLSRLVTRNEESGADEAGEPGTEKEEATKDAEVRALLDVAREEGILEEHEEELVSRAVDFGDRTVREVMTPRPDMTVAEADLPFSEIADLFVKTKFTRIPLVDGSVDRPVGVVHVKDVLTVLRSPDPPPTARPLAREPFFAPESQTVANLLADFRRRRQHMAIVVDEYGAVTGLVTLEDLVEELVGEIADEHEDALDPIIPLPDGSYSVAGRVRVSELASLFDAELEPGEYDTVAGLISARLGRIPRPGEKTTEAGLVFLVEEADRRRIYRAKVKRAEPAAVPVPTA